MTVLLISGAIATGKTAAAAEISRLQPAQLIKVRDVLGGLLGLEPRDRLTLQRRGAALDRRTAGRWLRDYIEEHRQPGMSIVIDALRTELQTLPILESIIDSRLVFLEAHETTRRARYAQAASSDPVKSSVDFDTAMHHVTETEVRRLRAMAHVVVETDELDPSGVAGEVLRELGLG
jgi:hypothetical protein